MIWVSAFPWTISACCFEVAGVETRAARSTELRWPVKVSLPWNSPNTQPSDSKTRLWTSCDLRIHHARKRGHAQSYVPELLTWQSHAVRLCHTYWLCSDRSGFNEEMIAALHHKVHHHQTLVLSQPMMAMMVEAAPNMHFWNLSVSPVCLGWSSSNDFGLKAPR